MPAKTYYFRANTETTGGITHLTLEETDGSSPSYGTGWVRDNVDVLHWSISLAGSVRSSSDFIDFQPTNASFNVAGVQQWRTLNPLTGDFAATDWTVTLKVKSSSAGASAAYRIGVALYKSGATGGSPTRLSPSSGWTYCADLDQTTSDQTATITLSPGAVITLTGEYLYLALLIEVRTQGVAGDDTLLRIENNGCQLGTPNFTPPAQIVTPPAADERYSAQAPTVSTPAVFVAPAIDARYSAHAPALASPTSLEAPVADGRYSAQAPANTSSFVEEAPVVDARLSAHAPTADTPALLTAPVADGRYSAHAPTLAGSVSIELAAVDARSSAQAPANTSSYTAQVSAAAMVAEAQDPAVDVPGHFVIEPADARFHTGHGYVKQPLPNGWLDTGIVGSVTYHGKIRLRPYGYYSLHPYPLTEGDFGTYAFRSGGELDPIAPGEFIPDEIDTGPPYPEHGGSGEVAVVAVELPDGRGPFIVWKGPRWRYFPPPLSPEFTLDIRITGLRLGTAHGGSGLEDPASYCLNVNTGRYWHWFADAGTEIEWDGPVGVSRQYNGGFETIGQPPADPLLVVDLGAELPPYAFGATVPPETAGSYDGVEFTEMQITDPAGTWDVDATDLQYMHVLAFDNGVLVGGGSAGEATARAEVYDPPFPVSKAVSYDVPWHFEYDLDVTDWNGTTLSCDVTDLTTWLTAHTYDFWGSEQTPYAATVAVPYTGGPWHPTDASWPHRFKSMAGNGSVYFSLDPTWAEAQDPPLADNDRGYLPVVSVQGRTDPNTADDPLYPVSISLPDEIDVLRPDGALASSWVTSDGAKLTVFEDTSETVITVTTLGAHVTRTLLTDSWRDRVGLGTGGTANPLWAHGNYEVTKHGYWGDTGQDVWYWGARRYLQLNVTAADDCTLVLTVRGVHLHTFDPHGEANESSTLEAWTKGWTFDLTAGANEVELDLLFPDGGGPFYISRVDSLELSGFPLGETHLTGMALVAHAVRLKNVYPNFSPVNDHLGSWGARVDGTDPWSHWGDGYAKGDERGEDLYGGDPRFAVTPRHIFDDAGVLTLEEFAITVSKLEGFSCLFDATAWNAANRDEWLHVLWGANGAAQYIGEFPWQSYTPGGADFTPPVRPVSHTFNMCQGYPFKIRVREIKHGAIDVLPVDGSGQPLAVGTDINLVGTRHDATTFIQDTQPTDARFVATFLDVPMNSPRDRTVSHSGFIIVDGVPIPIEWETTEDFAIRWSWEVA